MNKTPLLAVIILTVIAAGCISGGGTYTETITSTSITTHTQYSTTRILAFTTTTTTIEISTTTTIVQEETTTLNATTTTTTTLHINNITYSTKTIIVTFYYGDDGEPNPVYYTPTSGPLSMTVNISITTVYYPTKYSPLYTPILPVFIFYDKKYYSKLTEELGITAFPTDPAEYVSLINNLKSRIVIVKTWTYPTYIDAAISSGTLNEIELAQYFVGVAVLNSQTPTLVLISNRTASTPGIIIDGVALIGTRIFGNTAAMKAYYYNLISNHIEYYATVNPDHPGLTITAETITQAPPLTGMEITNITYTITVMEAIHGIQTLYTRTGTFAGTWGSFIETNATGDTITAYLHNSTIYLITNTFTTTTLNYCPACLTEIFLPAPLREEDIYYYNPTKTILLEKTDNTWLILTVEGTTATGTFINDYGESIGYYTAILNTS